MTADIPSYRFPEAARDRVVELCGGITGKQVLDVGCGDGLVGRALLSRIGPDGSVAFVDRDADVIAPLADDLRNDGRVRIAVDDATELRTILDDSIDVVVMRAVLLYIPDKRAAIQSAARVLRSGGRIVISEPINRPLYVPAERFWGFDLSAIPRIAAKMQEGFTDSNDPTVRAMLDWDDVDLATVIVNSGFSDVQMETFTEIVSGSVVPWLAFLHARWTPWMPSLAKVVAERLTSDEASEFERVVRPQLAAGLQRMVVRNTFITATHNE